MFWPDRTNFFFNFLFLTNMSWICSGRVTLEKKGKPELYFSEGAHFQFDIHVFNRRWISGGILDDEQWTHRTVLLSKFRVLLAQDDKIEILKWTQALPFV